MRFLEFLREYFELQDTRKACKSCETLKDQLAVANNNNNTLINQIIEMTKPAAPQQVKETETPPVPVLRNTHWRVKQAALEAEDRAKAARMREQEEFEKRAKEHAEKTNPSVAEPTTEEQLKEVENELADIAAKANNG